MLAGTWCASTCCGRSRCNEGGAGGGDHIAVDLKRVVKQHLETQGYVIVDCGTMSHKRAHYPIFGHRSATAVAEHRCERTIVMCGTGIGIVNAANKTKGVRAVLVNSVVGAEHAVRTLHANVIALGAKVIGAGLACMIADKFLTTVYRSDPANEQVIATINGLIKQENYSKKIFEKEVKK